MGLFDRNGKSLASYLLGRNQQPTYGSVDNGQQSPSIVPKPPPPTIRASSRSMSPLMSASAAVSSPRRDRFRHYDLEDLIEVDDEEGDETEELVNVPYTTLVRNYTLVPISAFLFLTALIALFNYAWPPAQQRHGLLPHLPSVLVGASAWIISYTLRLPILSLATFFGHLTNGITLTLSTVLSIALEEALRLGALVLLQLRLNPPPTEDWEEEWPRTGEIAFHKTFCVAVGWAIVEVCWSVAQGYEQLALYRDLLPPSPRSMQNFWSGSPNEQQPGTPTSESESISHHFVHAAVKKSASPPHSSLRYSSRPASAIEGLHGEEALEAEMRELINLQTRVELETVYGVPPPNIPVFLSVLQRIDSILLTIGLTLTISSVYLTQLQATIDPPPSQPAPLFNPPDVHLAILQTIPTYAILTLLHASLAVMWTEALPKLGMHVASYTALVVSLGAFFAGLGWWGALS